MATLSATSSTNGSPVMSSPSFKGLKKVLSNRRRSSEAQSETGIQAFRTESIDSMTLDKSPTRQSFNSSPTRDGSIKSSSSGVRKLLPGHNKRVRQKIREEELKIATEEEPRGRDLTISTPPPSARKRTEDSPAQDEDSLLTDDSEFDTAPPLISRNSHAGYLTASSPLITTSTVPDLPNGGEKAESQKSETDLPSLNPSKRAETSPSPKTSPMINGSTQSLPVPGLMDKADTLRPDSKGSSITRLRGKSPVRGFRNVFARTSKSPKTSPRTSPERRPAEYNTGINSPLSRESTLVVSEVDEVKEEPQDQKPTKNNIQEFKPIQTISDMNDQTRPLTPPAALINAPITTITPPTPTETQTHFDAANGSPRRGKDNSAIEDEGPGIVTSPTGMISHRRVRSAGSISHPPSKLSTSMTAPLTPTLEEVRTPSGGAAPSTSAPTNRTISGSFFSSWVSAAQNAASSITNLTQPNRSRSGTTASDPSSNKPVAETIKEEPESIESESPRKQLAVETLGSGELRFSHLGLDSDREAENGLRPRSTDLRKDSVIERDITAAKVEDILAKRAVSAAYEKPNDSTPVAEVPDPINNVRHAQTFSGAIGGEQTPPNGSIFEGETGSVKRNNSVRSKLANRRSRGSSTATGTTIGAMVGASTAALANPATGPRLSGFAMAPKQRNRNFHQQFRSVPEDDFLIEDYSCALQREIILAGRLYISEGHICFSSNILGWVTTLVISFEEVVSIERENTAIVIPNAIAIQTLHARHTFRSLLSREATYDLLIGIWKVSHPASFQKSMNGKQLAAEEATKDATGTGEANEESLPGTEGSSEDESDESDDDGSAPSMVGSSASVPASDSAESKSVSRKPSGMNGIAAVQAPSAASSLPSDAPATSAATTATPSAPVDFPGPTTHASTECTDSATHYDIIIKDETLSAPLGKVYSLLFGPQSGSFIRKFLVDECKSLDLVLEDDKKGLGADAKTRQYNYIKPLGGSIGPKQTKCITTETLDFFDLEKAVSVTCSTSTPDVPNGSSFLTKTRYCLTWGPGNSTRLQMNCTVEWSAKSWLKTAIEKGAKDGQQQYADSLVKSIKATIPRPRGMTMASKTSKTKKKRKGEKKDRSEKIEAEAKKQEDWGVFAPLQGPLGPVADIARPVFKTEIVITFLCFMVFFLWLRRPSSSQLGPYSGWKQADRFAAYQEMWNREESELWNWLEDRAGVDTITLQGFARSDHQERKNTQQQVKQRQRALKSKEAATRLKEEKMSEKEMEDAIRITKERLEILEGVVQKRKLARQASSASIAR